MINSGQLPFYLGLFGNYLYSGDVHALFLSQFCLSAMANIFCQTKWEVIREMRDYAYAATHADIKIANEPRPQSEAFWAWHQFAELMCVRHVGLWYEQPQLNHVSCQMKRRFHFHLFILYFSSCACNNNRWFSETSSREILMQILQRWSRGRRHHIFQSTHNTRPAEASIWEISIQRRNKLSTRLISDVLCLRRDVCMLAV